MPKCSLRMGKKKRIQGPEDRNRSWRRHSGQDRYVCQVRNHIEQYGYRGVDWGGPRTIAGHILECGGQASGGNFSASWRSVPDLAHIGFPIAEAYSSGEIIITKHEQSGGLVSMQTVKEQLLYEIGDPSDYITPDCVADFTSIQLEEVGKDRVRMYNVKGRPATDSYKVSM